MPPTNAPRPAPAVLLPPPSSLGCPPKFTKWRDLQSQAVLAAIESDKRFVVQSQPTGSGKSLVAVTQALLTGRTLILTSTKGLQEQYTRDFGEIGMLDIRGMNNYVCRVLDVDGRGQGRGHDGPFVRAATSCEQGPCTVGEKCQWEEDGCTYFDQLRKAQAADLVITNYAYWMVNQAYGRPDRSLGKFDLLVLDEAHDAPDNLSGFLEVEMEAHEIEEMLETKMLEAGSSPDQWADWARYHYKRAEDRVDEMVDEVRELRENGEPVPTDLRKAIKAWRMLATKLGRLAEMKADWVVEHVGRGGKFSPIWPGGYAERFLFRGVPKVVLVSATIRPRTAHYLGLRTEGADPDIDFHEYPSTFAVARRPVIHIPTVQMNWRNEQDEGSMRRLYSRVDQIIRARTDRKGIIHTVSYKRAMALYQNSGHSHLMMRPSSDTTRRVVEDFKLKRPSSGAVLVSPAVTTGYDFPGDQCRYQIILKLPIPDTRPAIMKARTESDREYGPYLTMQTLVQMVGRGMRAEDDWCETFVLDNNIDWWLWKYKAYAPKWFLDSYQKAVNLPGVMAFVSGGGR